jgi:hypothetical protein
MREILAGAHVQGGGDSAQCRGSFPMEFLGKTNLQGKTFGQLGELFRADLASLQLLRQQTGRVSESLCAGHNLREKGKMTKREEIQRTIHYILLGKNY